MGEEKKRDQGTEGGPPKPIPVIDARIGDEEQNGKQEGKRKNREWVPKPATQDHSVASYDAQRSYGEPILFTSPAHRGYIYYYYFY